MELAELCLDESGLDEADVCGDEWLASRRGHDSHRTSNGPRPEDACLEGG